VSAVKIVFCRHDLIQGFLFIFFSLNTLLAAMIQCFDFKLVGPHGEIMDGENAVVDMDERPGLTAPRAHDLVCVPIARLSHLIISLTHKGKV
jgi:hypothetical protein